MIMAKPQGMPRVAVGLNGKFLAQFLQPAIASFCNPATLASVGTTPVVCFLALSPVMCSRLASFCAVVLSDEVSARDCRHATRRSPVYCAHKTTKQQLNNSCAGLAAFAPLHGVCLRLSSEHTSLPLRHGEGFLT